MLDLAKNQKYINKNHIVNIASWMRNQIANLCNPVSAPITATPDALAERLQSIPKTALLCNRMMDNIEYGLEGLIYRRKSCKVRRGTRTRKTMEQEKEIDNKISI